MTKDITRRTATIYAVSLGIFGVHDFYLNRNKQGIAHFLFTTVPLYYFLLLSTKLRSELSTTELVDNLYMPTLSGPSLILYSAINIIMFLTFIINIVWLLVELIMLARHKLKIPQNNTITTPRYLALALILGWTGIHDALADRHKCAHLHFYFALASIAFIIIGIRPYSLVPSVAMVLGVGTFIINQVIAIIEGSHAFWYNKIKQQRS